MSDPINPNFKPGVGRLVTDRYDFQKHVDGYSFRHKAKAIDLSPTITIDSVVTSNVQDAIQKLSEIAFGGGGSVSDASTSVKGIVQLAGDIGGTATNVRVTKIQNYAVVNTPPTSNQVLAWNGSAWAPSTLSSTFIADGDLGGNNTSQTVVGIRTRPMAATAPTTNQVIAWNGSTWTPTTIMPTGTGFATTTSGVFDSAATANIRYAGGKLQTDVNVQWKNGSITGDLQWSLGSSNRVLLLPDTSDTLVGRVFAQTLESKTISVSNNAITATSIATGDILACIAGSSFDRLAKGANGSYLGVQSGVLGYYTPSSSTPTGTGFATVTSGVYDGYATPNIRYTGGKFQTDTGVQYKAGSVTLDLVWAAGSSNRIMYVPDFDDTLVVRNGAQTLTSKTISISNNAITATSIATGDLMKSNGSSFDRFAKGTALQVLRVNSGATDLEWATLSSSLKWTQGAYSATLSGSITLTPTEEANQIFYFSGTGGTYIITMPNPSTDADAHTHYVEVGPNLDIVFSTGGGTTYGIATTGATKRGHIAVCNNKVTGNIA